MLSCRWPRIPASSEQQITAEPIDLTFVESPDRCMRRPLLAVAFQSSWKAGQAFSQGRLLPNPSLKREAYRNDPAVVILVKLRYRDLHASANAQVKSFRDWKSA